VALPLEAESSHVYPIEQSKPAAGKLAAGLFCMYINDASRCEMNLLFDGDVYSTDEDGARLLARQAERAKTSVQIASLDGSSPSWVPLSDPCLVLVSRRKAVRLTGKELDALISVCKRHGEFFVGHPLRQREAHDDQSPPAAAP
jgi:hypothetical protein